MPLLSIGATGEVVTHVCARATSTGNLVHCCYERPPYHEQ